MRCLILPNRKSGFTLIELMMVAAIVGLLASIAIPKFSELIGKAKESSVKGNLGTLRGALTVYYADTEGNRPWTLSPLTTGAKYLQVIPAISIPKNTNNTGHPTVDNNSASSLDDTSSSRWLFIQASGTVFVNCSHRDTKGSIWFSW